MSERHLLAAVGLMMMKKAAVEAAENVSQEWADKQNDWAARQRNNIDRWSSTIDDNDIRLEAIRKEIAKLEGMIANATNENFKVKVQGWKAEQQNRWNRINETNDDLLSKINDVESKLRNQGKNKPWFYREGSGSNRLRKRIILGPVRR